MSGPVGIVGAGITGLTLHKVLRDRGRATVVFEASPTVGGVIRSSKHGDRVLDVGPQRTRLTPPIRDLVADLGLDADLIHARDVPLYVYVDGKCRRVPFSLPEAIRTDLLSVRGKLRTICEPVVGGAPKSGESVESYLHRAFGREFATRLGGPLYAGLYGSDPAHMPVEHSLARAFDHMGVSQSLLVWLVRSRLRGRTPPPVVTFRNGMQSLPNAIFDHYPDGLYVDEPVQTIVERSAGYELQTADRSMSVDTVVVTTPAARAASLMREIAPDAAAALDSLTYNSFATVHLHAPDATHDGAGHTIPLSEGFQTRGVTWNATLFGASGAKAGRAGVYTCFLGEVARGSILELTDEQLAHWAIDEFQRVTGNPSSALRVSRIRPGMPAYDYTWDALKRLSLPTGLHLCANYTARAGIPGRVSAAEKLGESLTTTGESYD